MKIKLWPVLFIILATSQLNSDQFSGQPQGFVPRRTLVSAWYMNEGAGTVAYDVTGRGHGDLTGGPAWVSGKHGQGIGFSGSSDRVQVRNQGSYTFIDVTATFTVIIVYQAISRPNGWFISKQTNFAAIGWNLRGQSVAVGDFSFEWRSAGGLFKTYTNVLTVDKSGGSKWHVLIYDYSCNSNGLTLGASKFSLDGSLYDLNEDYAEPVTGSFSNTDLVSINGVNDGTSNGTKGNDDMVAIYRGDGQKPLTAADHRAIASTILFSKGF